MKRLVLILFTLIIAGALDAQELNFSSSDKFEIKEMNVYSITIDGKPLKEGDTFFYTQTITWSKDGDMFVTKWVGHDKYFRFEYNKNLENGLPAIDYIKTNKTLHKGTSSARIILSDTFYFVKNPFLIDVSEIVDDKHYFIFRYKGKQYQIPSVNEHVLRIDPSDYPFIYDSDGSVKLRVSYITLDERENKVEESVTSNMVIQRIITK